MTKTSARKWQAAKKNFKKVFEDNDKENAKSRPSVYSVYLHKKICMLCIIDAVYRRHQMMMWSLFLTGLNNYYWRFLGLRNHL